MNQCGSRGRAAVVAALCLIVNACGRSEDDRYSLAAQGELPYTAEVEDFVLEFVETLGDTVLPPSFSYHGPAALSQDEKVLLRSHSDCKFAVLNAVGGRLERYFGRCGDGPNETRIIWGAGLYRDTVIFADPVPGTFRFVGGSDTVSRRLIVGGLQAPGLLGINAMQVLNDSMAFLTVVRQPTSGAVDGTGELFAFLDLRSGAITWLPFVEPVQRRNTVVESTRFYGACTHNASSVVVIENNGPAELLGVTRSGRTEWVRRFEVTGVRLDRSPNAASTAAFKWNRLPVRPACSSNMMASRMLSSENSGAGVIGNLILARYDGEVLMNLPLRHKDAVFTYAGWFAGDSMFYVAASQAESPQVVVLRPRPRRAEERGSGPLLVPDEVRQRLSKPRSPFIGGG